MVPIYGGSEDTFWTSAQSGIQRTPPVTAIALRLDVSSFNLFYWVPAWVALLIRRERVTGKGPLPKALGWNT